MSQATDSKITTLNAADPFERTARQLHKFARQLHSLDWDRARFYVTVYPPLVAAVLAQKPEINNKPKAISREVNEQLDRTYRKLYGQPPPIGRTFRSDALKVLDLWEDIFRSGTKLSQYQFYRQIAVCSLPAEEKEELRQWIEEQPVTKEQLRARIRTLVDERQGIYEPDFPVRYGNWWNFGVVESELGDFQGGIHPYVVANLLHYFTDPGDTVIDPMAGGDTTYRVTQTFRFFQEQDDNRPNSGPRPVAARMSDTDRPKK